MSCEDSPPVVESPNEFSQKQRDAFLVINRFLRNICGKKLVLISLRKKIDCTLQKEQVSGLNLFMVARQLLFLYQSDIDGERFSKLCRLLLKNMDRDTIKGCYLAVSLDRRYAIQWISQMKKILCLCCKQLHRLKKATLPSRELLDLNLNMLVLFTDYTLWKFTAKLGEAVQSSLHLLCTNLIQHLVNSDYYGAMQWLLDNFLLSSYLTGHSLTAIMGFRQLAICQFPQSMLLEFATRILSVPGCILHLELKAPESLQKLQKVGFVVHILKAVSKSGDSFSKVNVNSALSILGNLVNLCSLHIEDIERSKDTALLMSVLTQVVNLCDSSRLSKGSSVSGWHPFFGWIKADIDRRNIDGLTMVRKQFQSLWNGPMVQTLMRGVLMQSSLKASDQSRKGTRMLIFRKRTTEPKVHQSVLEEVNSGCGLYMACLQMFPLLATDILVGLSCNGDVICKLWHLLGNLSCLKVDHSFKMITNDRSPQSPLRSVLILAIEATQYLIATLDDEELHVKQQYFSVDDLQDISLFMNQLVYRMVSEDKISTVFSHCHALLTLLHSRDCRRAFTSDASFWVERKIKVAVVLKDLKVGKKNASNLLKYIPHCIARKKRIEIFMENVKEDKESLGLLDRSYQRAATYITIQRGRILEGGYEQLSKLAVNALKGTIRVKFVNEQGLDEAGIDETGVFKEFLEEVISTAFNPALGLFKLSSNGLLFPSPNSSIHDNHLSLFEFIGRILGKAVYEGIVVDVQFAPFFLSQILEHHLTSLYSSLDELVSLDSEVYKSLSFIKHADSGVEDLCLTFTWDEECLGKVISHELVPGGSCIEVTMANKISYVHRMAYYMLYTRMKQQSVAFLKGFHSVIERSWIGMFSPSELQSLISGEQVEFDIDDLRKYVQYMGGYHAKHKVILWLWEILAKDLDAKQKGAFLKFVTSCSRPPLLGFSHLNPPFSIRCVDLSEQEDHGDSLGTVLRGFLSLRQQASSSRLPTASTCFNLLKLPNYSKKSTLREKLKYAIASNAGFELS